MVSTYYFTPFALLSIFSWCIYLLFNLYLSKNTINKIAAEVFFFLGLASLTFFILDLWFTIKRFPLNTIGETRFWYSYFLSILSYTVYKRWRFKWFLLYGIIMSVIFLFINIIHPENFTIETAPALQSKWYVPHVLVYLLSYSLLGAVSIIGIYSLIQSTYKKLPQSQNIQLADNLVRMGFGFLTLGLIFGVFWAKQAWGHYWNWDPKQTWAFLSWLLYLLYLHFRLHFPLKEKMAFFLLVTTFGILLLSWLGFTLLDFRNNSIHNF